MTASSHEDTHFPSCSADARLTPARQAALDVLLRENRAVGAYELIELIKATDGRRLAPAQVYRALDFLVERGLAHRLASRNAYMACQHKHEARALVAFLICEVCGQVEEACSPALERELRTLTKKMRFAARARTIEVAGRCAACAA